MATETLSETLPKEGGSAKRHNNPKLISYQALRSKSTDFVELAMEIDYLSRNANSVPTCFIKSRWRKLKEMFEKLCIIYQGRRTLFAEQ